MILEPGTAAPDFALPNQFGRTVALGDFRGVSPLTLVFFPLAFSRTCQGELCELRDHLELFADAGSRLVAISVDSKHSLRAWAEEQGYDFPLLADFWPHGEVARAYGAFNEERGYASRATFVIDVDGVIRSSFATAPGEARTLEQYRAALAS
ncbi:peroxiredoxin [Agromyces ramosus]|jgi:peroxiredoxin|uniref:Alkyl hydroperoxide reductase E n=1 Tax=Agromyces ramosus TaxID=33879 RepID=A0A4Q7MFP9_9MICO|nr:peroxiredoxin [Agromyces ramosus]RZS66387.1 peroxiredoxin [Agromyces ramosus]